MRRHIDIDICPGISINLSKEEYDKFCIKLCDSLKEEIYISINRFENANKKIKEARNFMLEIRSLFYDEEESDFVWKKDIDEIDNEKLNSILNKYSSFLELE